MSANKDFHLVLVMIVMTVDSCLFVMFRFWFCVFYSPAFDFHDFCLVSHVLLSSPMYFPC